MARQRRPMIGIGLLLLAHKLYSVGINTLPPVTLLAIVGQTLLFLGIINPPWDRYDVCISGESILIHKDYRRLVLSAIEHADDIHLYYNMASLMLKGRSLELRYGSVKFCILLAVFTIATSLTYVGLVWGATEIFETYSYMRQCAIGFSGVLFALKVLTTHYEGGASHYVHGILVPTKYAVWVELVIIQVLVPRASFIGHLAGILVGVAYISGPLKYLIDGICGLIPVMGLRGSFAPSYTYTRSTVGSNPYQDSPPEYSRQNYGWNVNGSYTQTEQSSQGNQFNENDQFRTYPAQPTVEELRQHRINRFL
ncbi:rhomboid-related protein 4 [Procambarus clarkii]|uniref:rhomboid-related protein 4 n=1 Tax=Procambarus clarkii TaxID=6728 RepID=UPI00374317E2